MGSAQRMKQVSDIILDGEPKIVVLSAVSGTTNALVEIGEKIGANLQDEAKKLIEKLEASYYVIIEDLYQKQESKDRAKEIILEHFNFMKSFVVKVYNVFQERTLLAQGELISTKLFHIFLLENNVNAVLLPALDFMRIDIDEEPDMPYIREHAAKELAKQPGAEIYITQGFICRNSFGEIDNLKRGGSDYTASIIGNAINASEIQIWTDIDGMHNNDPRVVEKTKPVAKLNFDEAAELAYFGAKILHPQSVFPAQKYKIPVRLLNTMEPSAFGTLISSESEKGKIKSIAAKDGITAIKIQSSRMLLAYGFLRRVFEVFERYKTPIDMITTSEVAVSVTIDDTKYLGEITKELSDFGVVEVDVNQSIVCVVGDLSTNSHGFGARILESIKHIPLMLISYGGSQHNLSFLIKTEDKVEALRSLHNRLFE